MKPELLQNELQMPLQAVRHLNVTKSKWHTSLFTLNSPCPALLHQLAWPKFLACCQTSSKGDLSTLEAYMSTLLRLPPANGAISLVALYI